jgi:hypothetical protein
MVGSSRKGGGLANVRTDFEDYFYRHGIPTSHDPSWVRWTRNLSTEEKNDNAPFDIEQDRLDEALEANEMTILHLTRR